MLRPLLVLPTLWLLFSAVAHAQFYVPPPDYFQQSSFINTNYLNNSLLLDEADAEQADDADTPQKQPREAPKQLDFSRLLVTPAANPATPARLAKLQPAAARANAEEEYRRLLQTYRQLEQQFSIPSGDLGGATAAVIAGSYAAYTGQNIPDPHFIALVRQVREALAANPDIAKAPLSDRQAQFEQSAIIGLLLALSTIELQKRPDPAVSSQIRKLGADYIRRMLGVEPSMVTIGADGLSLR